MERCVGQDQQEDLTREDESSRADYIDADRLMDSPWAAKGAPKSAIEEHIKQFLGVNLSLRSKWAPRASGAPRQPRRLRAIAVISCTLVAITQA